MPLAPFGGPHATVERETEEELDARWCFCLPELPGAKQRRRASKEGSVGGRYRVLPVGRPFPDEAVHLHGIKYDSAQQLPDLEILAQHLSGRRAHDVAHPAVL